MKKIQILTAIAIICGLLGAGKSRAQMTGGSVFLKGRYVEAGICTNGDFGAATPPAGYHPHLSTAGGGASLGFVADPAMDGWAVGTPAYVGDYFVPGSPFEGWNLQIGGLRAQAHSCGGFTGTGLTGGNTAYTVSGSKVIGMWIGSFDSMTVKQETTLDTNALYFSMKVTLINNASVPKNNIYYMRSLDPDNDQSWAGGGFTTTNKIEYQQPNAIGASMVSATGATGAITKMSLGTLDTNARCLVYSSWPLVSSTDLATVYGMSYATSTSLYTAGATNTADVAIGLVFRVPHLAPVDSASDSVGYKTTSTVHLHPANEKSFTYFYAFSQAGADSAIADLIDTATVIVPPPPTAVNNINTETAIKVYPNPAGSMINVSGLAATDRLELYDMMGRNVSPVWTISDSEVNDLSLQDIPNGNYILIVKDMAGRTKSHVPVRKQ
jgi:hypothetical protein